jgi:hypothetical protein
MNFTKRDIARIARFGQEHPNDVLSITCMPPSVNGTDGLDARLVFEYRDLSTGTEAIPPTIGVFFVE